MTHTVVSENFLKCPFHLRKKMAENFLFPQLHMLRANPLGEGFCKFEKDEIFKILLLISRFISERDFERKNFCHVQNCSAVLY